MIFEYKTKEDRDRVYCNLLIELTEGQFEEKILEIKPEYKGFEIEFMGSESDDIVGDLIISKTESWETRKKDTELESTKIAISFLKYEDWPELIDFRTFFTVCEIIEFLKSEAINYGITEEENKNWREVWVEKRPIEERRGRTIRKM